MIVAIRSRNRIVILLVDNHFYCILFFCIALYHWQARRHVMNIMQDIGKSCILTFFFAFTDVVDLLFNVLSIICGSSVFVFVLLCITLCPV